MGDKPKNELEAVEVRRRRGFRKLLAFAGLLSSGDKNRKDQNRRTTFAAETAQTQFPVPSSPLANVQEELTEDTSPKTPPTDSRENNNNNNSDSTKIKSEDPLPSPVYHRQTTGGSQILRSSSTTNARTPPPMANVSAHVSTSAGNLSQDTSPLAHLESQMDEATRHRLATEGGRGNKRHSVFMVLFKGKNENGPESERKQEEKHTKKEKPKEKEKKEEPHPPPTEETIIATCFDELPAETQKPFLNAKLELEDLKNPSNWSIICHIASFRMNKRILSALPELKAEAGLGASTYSGAQVAQDGTHDTPDGNAHEKHSNDIVIDNMTLDECEEKFILKNPDQNPKKLYKNLTACGEGGYGRVFQATSAIDKGKIAIKKIPHTVTKERRHNVQEIFFLTSCKHPNIVKYVRTHFLNDELWIVLEFMEGGTLGEAVAAYSFDENQIAFVAREMLLALHYLHEKKWAHRDLKSSNIMMTVGGEVKLVDFGLCADLSEGGKTHMCGSPYWMPPEMIRKEPHGVLVDIWSLAICLLELANKHPPNYKNPIKAMFDVATVGIREPFENGANWSESFKNFTSLCLVDASSRATAESLKSHEFLKKAAPRHVMEKVFRRLFLTNMMMPLP